jgi:putative endonuclease
MDRAAPSPRQPSSTRDLGRLGEDLAVEFLVRRGLEILARNLRSRLGEVDILAQEGLTLVFVEVKARRAGSGDPPQVAVHAKKQARLARLALGYLAAHRLGDRACRFDVVAVTLTTLPGDARPSATGDGVSDSASPRLEYFPGAFRLDGWTG